MQHHLKKHYSKHKHFNLISWLCDGYIYIYSETIRSSLSAKDGQEKSHFTVMT